MAFNIAKGRISPIAIDFGADSLKLLQVIPSDPPQLVAAGYLELPEHVRKDPSQRHQFYTESLKMLLKSQPFRGKRAICSIPSYQTLVHHFQVPRTDQGNTEDQVGIQLRQRLNVDPTRMVMRVHNIGTIGNDSTKDEVICLAAGKESVMRHIECAHRAKLDVVGMQCEPMAIAQAFSYLFKDDKEGKRTTCFIDIGAATTKVLITNGDQIVFSKTIHAAGDHLTRFYAASEKLSFGEARELRMRAVSGTSQGDDQTAAAVADQPTIEAESFGDTLECLVDELQMCVRYYAKLYPDRGIERLVFLGGEAQHKSLCQAIAKSLHTAAQIGDPTARMAKVGKAKGSYAVDFSKPQPGWAVPLGLCLSESNL